MQKTNNIIDIPDNLVVLMKNAKVVCDCNPSTYNDLQIKEIIDILSELSKEICIDKTYVDFPESKYQKVFITEDGWNLLCLILHDSTYGKTASSQLKKILSEMYKMLIVLYLYLCLEDLEYKIEDIHIGIEDCRFEVKIYKGVLLIEYPGKWQTWKSMN